MRDKLEEILSRDEQLRTMTHNHSYLSYGSKNYCTVSVFINLLKSFFIVNK